MGIFFFSERAQLFARANLCLPQFRGLISQVPSMFSALKHQGQPLYKLARAGKTVAVKPRQVTIHNLELLSFKHSQVQMDISCTKGTYIRSIVEDLGLALDCGAHVAQLRRLQAGPFVAEQMVTLEDLQGIIDEATQGQVVEAGQWPDITPAFSPRVWVATMYPPPPEGKYSMIRE